MTKIAIIGGGPAGVMCAIFAARNPENEIFIFDKNIILNTLLPTGGGRCNLANAIFDYKELAKNYPAGEKFLYSIFSKFATKETLDFFEQIGVKTYTQDDGRIFPTTNSSKDVKIALLEQINKQKNIKKIFENVLEIKKIDNLFELKTNKISYQFDKVVISTGGRGTGQKLAKSLGHNITELRPALSSLITKEQNFSSLSGLSLKNITAKVDIESKEKNKRYECLKKPIKGDFLFTHKGISGPIVYKISSYCAYLNFDKNNPLKISFNFVNKNFEQFDTEFLSVLKSSPQKESANILAEFLPKNLVLKIFEILKINPTTKAGQLTKLDRQKISQKVTDFMILATGINKGEEIVTAGGINLKEINSKTLESKLISNLYFCGEVIDIDGLTGGFNLQNCWSGGYIVGITLQNN